MLTFTNPRLRADFADWPSGSARVQCVFEVLHERRGWRVSRTTTDKHGQWCKPKFSTYSGQAVIVDGSDGLTYILQVAGGYGFINIMRYDFKNADPASVFERAEPERHAELMRLIVNGGSFNQEIKS